MLTPFVSHKLLVFVDNIIASYNREVEQEECTLKLVASTFIFKAVAIHYPIFLHWTHLNNVYFDVGRNSLIYISTWDAIHESHLCLAKNGTQFVTSL